MARMKDSATIERERVEQVQKLTGQYPIPTNRKALLYSRYSSAKQVVSSISKGLQQSDGLIRRGIDIGWKREDMTLFIENSLNKNGRVKSVSGTIPIEDRAGISTVIEHVKLGCKACEEIAKQKQDGQKHVTTAIKHSTTGAGAILCDDISRLTRDADLVDAATLAQICKQHDCIIVTNDRIFNFKRQADYDSYMAEAQAAAAFIELHIKGKMLKNRARKAESGRVANATAPVGLKLNSTRDGLLPSPHQSGLAWLYRRFAELEASRNDLLRECNAMAQAGKPLFPIDERIDPKTIFLQKVFNDEGTLLGWTVGSRAGLTDILTNPAYIGHLVFNGEIQKRNAHPAIVDEDLFYYAFNLLAKTDLEHRAIERPAKTVRYSRPESQQTALLAGTRYNGTPVIDGTGNLHVYVNVAEQAYVLQSSRGNTGTGGYETSIKIVDLDALIETRLLVWLTQFEKQAHKTLPGMTTFETAKKSPTVPDDSLETLEAEIAQIQDDLEFASGVMDRETRIGKYEKLARLSQRRDKLTTNQKEKERQQCRLEKAKKSVENAYGLWHSWSLEEKQSFIHVVTRFIVLEEIAAGWLRVSIQWSAILVDRVEECYIWRTSGTLWTQEEAAILKAHYPTATRVELLRLLPTRSWTAISRKASLLSKIAPLRRLAASDPLLFGDTTSLTDLEVIAQYGLEQCDEEDPDKRVYWLSGQASGYDMGKDHLVRV